ncbi:MAG: hypothetical protein KatS3mg131_3562 [Candidatus Tectimicrobiota bacterium]|nr:MAG: hypothetical protein KatS3mg131_3562 [Candidatus Tectomicrobia bacterium]
MGAVVLVSLLIRLVALGWSLVLLRRWRDRRLAWLSGLLVLAVLRQGWTLAAGVPPLAELPGLVLSPLLLLATLCLARFLTVHHAAHVALQESEARYRHLVENSLGLICTHALDGTLLTVNPAAAQALGYTPQELVGKNLQELLAPAVRHLFPAYLQRIREQPSDSGYMRVVTKAGEERIWLYRNVRIDDAGREPYVLGHALDVSERVQAERALALRVRQLEAVRQVSIELTQELDLSRLLEAIVARAIELVEPATEGAVCLWDEEKQALIPRAWRGYGDWLGRVQVRLGEGVVGVVVARRQGMVVNNYRELPHAHPLLLAHSPHTAAVAEPLRCRERVVGAIILTNAGTGHPFAEPHREILGLFAAQAAVAIEQTRLFQEIQASRDFLQAITRCSPEAIVTTDVRGRLTYVSPGAETLFGYRAEAICGQRLADFCRGGHEEARRVMAQLRQNEQIRDYETAVRTSDGRWVEVSCSIALLRSSGGEVMGTLTVAKDVTARKILERQLRQAQKMEAIGTLAGGIAHEFNNLLGAILGYAELALLELPANSSIGAHLRQIFTAGSRARELVQQLLTFSRDTEQERQPVRLHLLVQEALSLLRASLPATIALRHQVCTEDDLVLANPVQLRQLLLHLASNAQHAMRHGGGVLDITLAPVDVDAAFAVQHPPLKPGPHVRLAVRDTGHGIEAALLERIFEPFFTTKEVGEGTGMGLALVHSIVARHQGAITVESTPGRGTQFTVYLPRLTAAAVAAKEVPQVLANGTPAAS